MQWYLTVFEAIVLIADIRINPILSSSENENTRSACEIRPIRKLDSSNSFVYNKMEANGDKRRETRIGVWMASIAR
jgi:hypothetical protein